MSKAGGGASRARRRAAARRDRRDSPARPSLDEVAQAARAAVLESFRPDSCIATTRVTIDVLAYFGYTGQPLAVKTAVFNQHAWRLLHAGVPVSEWPPEAHSIGIGGAGQHRPGRWDGHLVAVTTTHMIDGSLDQMSRPARGIILPGPGVFEIPAGRRGASPGTLTFRRGDGTVIMYEPIPDDLWRRSVNWSAKTPDIRRAIGTAIRTLQANLGATATRHPGRGPWQEPGRLGTRPWGTRRGSSKQVCERCGYDGQPWATFGAVLPHPGETVIWRGRRTVSN
jgi:hypothetical protein